MSPDPTIGGPLRVLRHMRLGQKVTLSVLASCLPLVALGVQVAGVAGGMVKEQTIDNVAMAAQIESNRIDSRVNRAVNSFYAQASEVRMVDAVEAMKGPGANEASATLTRLVTDLRDQLAADGLRGVELVLSGTERLAPDRGSNTISDPTVAASLAIEPGEQRLISTAFFDNRRQARISVVAQVISGPTRYKLISEWDLASMLGGGGDVSAFGSDSNMMLLAPNTDGTYLVLMSTDAGIVAQPASLESNPEIDDPLVSETSLPTGQDVVRASARTRQETLGWIVVVDADSEQLFSGLQRVRTGIITVFVSAGMVIISVVAVLLRSFVRRLARMTELAEAVADGDLTVRTGDQRFDELGRLSMAFDDMTEALAQDIARRERVEAQLAHQATHDALTGLPNRQQLVEELDRVLVESEDLVSVLFVDLDGFKAVNDRLGHGAGDELLVRVGDRLRGVLRPSDFVARLGGDEFVVVLRDLGLLEAERMAERIVAALELPFIVSNDEAQISASIGVSSASDERSTERLIKEADLAMYRAKAMGKGRAVRVTDEALAEADTHMSIRAELRQATANGQMELLLWPVADLRDGSLRGFESTVRWRHPTRGLLLPADFLPMAQASGCASQIDEWVVTETMSLYRRWIDEGVAVQDVEIAINLTTEMFLSARSRQLVTSELDRLGLKASRFRIEVPESVLRADGTVLRQVFDTYRAIGMPVTLDRFGSDFANLDRLPRFAIDAVKIDLNLISNLSSRVSSRALVSSLVALAKTAGLRVSAAGVDDEILRAEVIELGCTIGQGLWLSQVVTPFEAGEMLRSRYLIEAG